MVSEGSRPYKVRAFMLSYLVGQVTHASGLTREMARPSVENASQVQVFDAHIENAVSLGDGTGF